MLSPAKDNSIGHGKDKLGRLYDYNKINMVNQNHRKVDGIGRVEDQQEMCPVEVKKQDNKRPLFPSSHTEKCE
jgi:hypothetical protein